MAKSMSSSGLLSIQVLVSIAASVATVSFAQADGGTADACQAASERAALHDLVMAERNNGSYEGAQTDAAEKTGLCSSIADAASDVLGAAGVVGPHGENFPIGSDPARDNSIATRLRTKGIHMTGVQVMENRFFCELYRIAFDQNLEVWKDRQALEGLETDLKKPNGKLWPEDMTFLREISHDYGVSDSGPALTVISNLLDRVDVIPVAFLVAQGSIESSWGNSRFAKVANNFYGRHCPEVTSGVPTKGCAPALGNPKVSEIIYANLADQMKDQIRFMNTSPAGFAVRFRALRAQLKQSPGATLPPEQFFAVMSGYSADQQTYLASLTARFNRFDLEQFALDHSGDSEASSRPNLCTRAGSDVLAGE